MITDPRKYVAKWLSLKNITVEANGDLISLDKRSKDELYDTMYLDYCEQIDNFNKATDKKIRGAPESNVRKALDELISLEVIKTRQEIFNTIKFSGVENLSHLETFVVATTGKSDTTTLGVMAHFLCSIKRKMMGARVSYHMMPILYGKQEAGKTRVLQQLFAPLSRVTLHLDLIDLTDSRYHFTLNKNFVAILNEMAGADRADVDKLKNIITSEEKDARKLGTNYVSKIKQNCSFIGTTNKPVSEIIFDPTGARRFYEIKTLDKMNWEMLASIDYVALYRGIDEGKEAEYLLNIKGEVEKHQEDLTGVDELKTFLEIYKITSGQKEFSSILLYDTYKAWAEDNGIKNILNSVWLGRKLKNRGIEQKLKFVNGKTQRMYSINDDSDIFKKSYDPLAAPEIKKWN